MIEGAKFSAQSLQFRRTNPAKGKMTLRHSWDVISRDDGQQRLLIETWGGKPDGYIKCFNTDIQLGTYLSARIAKASKGVSDDQLDLSLIGEAQFAVAGDWDKLDKAMSGTTNHENSQMRLGIKGISNDWSEDACFDKTLRGLFDFNDPYVETNLLTAALAGRVKATFKDGSAGGWVENLSAIDQFIKASGTSLDDVLGDEEGAPSEWPPMDRERIVGIVQIADGLRDKMVASGPVVEPEDDPNYDDQSIEAVLESEMTRSESWGGWA